MKASVEQYLDSSEYIDWTHTLALSAGNISSRCRSNRLIPAYKVTRAFIGRRLKYAVG